MGLIAAVTYLEFAHVCAYGERCEEGENLDCDSLYHSCRYIIRTLNN